MKRVCAVLGVGGLLFCGAVGARAESNANTWAQEVLRLEVALNEIESHAHELQTRAEAAERSGSAMQLSCLNQHTRYLRSSLMTARSVAQSASLGERNPAFLRRAIERMAAIEKFVGTEYNAGLSCASVKEAKNSFEVSVHSFVAADAPEDAPLWSTPLREQTSVLGQPQLASPF